MGPLTIEQIASITEGKIIKGDADLKVQNISIDSRTLQKGDLFIPLIGENFDGHEFIQRAVLEGGAAATLTQEDIGDLNLEDVAIIRVEDTLKSLQAIATYNRKRYNIPIIAITGSSGKTTTKDMVYKVLSKKYDALKTEGNLNNEIGLPLTLLRLEAHHEIAVLELGMNHLGEIHNLVHMALPDIGVITNVGLSHIGELGSQENILRAKMEIFDVKRDSILAILNGDDPLLKYNDWDFLTRPTAFIGKSKHHDLQASNIVQGVDGNISYDIDIDGIPYTIGLSMPGIHNVYNSLFAVYIGLLYAVPIEDIQDALYEFKPGNMRLNIFKGILETTVIDDSYNANPNSMKAAIETLKDLNRGRKLAILGDMLELGRYSEDAHKSIGKIVANLGIDILITKGRDSRFIGMEAESQGMKRENIYHFDSNKEIVDFLKTFVKIGDIVLVKGSRGMQMEEIVSYLDERRHKV
ncbi:MAG: UDP-N-acetylmuramoyl-tripeptide--D-alanyl-D-alanine ligase [Clostridiales bacterium]|nr:UDP-N-acetylmuramoyl-tripeptide--D-alanyl-D-alanine ligase [Clostridiales bacterium]